MNIHCIGKVMKKSNSFQKNTILLTIGTIVNKGLQFFAVLLYSRWLSTEEYGQFDLLYTYVSLLIPVITLSNQEAVFRFSVNEEMKTTKNAYISCGLCFDVVNYLLYLGIAYLIIGRSNFNLYAIFSFYLFSELLSTYLRGFLRAIKRLDIYSFVLVLQTIAMFFFVTIFVFCFKFGLNGMLFGYACGTFVGDIILTLWGDFFSYFQIRAGVSLSKIKELIRYSVPLVPNEISWWVMNASDRQIINLFWGDAVNGIFAITHKIPALCSVVFNMFAISWQQEIVTKVENNEDANANVVFNKLLVTLFSVCSCLLAGSFVFYFYFFDRKYFEAILYSPILITSAVGMAIAQFYGGIQAAYKRTKNTGGTTVVGALVNIAVHLLLINVWGLYAAAISTLIANIVIILLRVISVKDVFRMKIKRKTGLVFLVFMYFFIAAYFNKNMYFNWINFIVSIIFTGFINRDLVKKTIYTVIRR